LAREARIEVRTFAAARRIIFMHLKNETVGFVFQMHEDIFRLARGSPEE
jgi:hypothetical protein